MDFALNETQEVFKNTAQKFFKEKCTTPALREFENSTEKYSPALYKEIADLGFLGLIIPEEYGGVGGSLMDLAIVVEEAGRSALPSPFISTIAYGVLPLLQNGTESQKRELLPRIAEGELIITGAFSEPQAHYDIKHVKTSVKENKLSGIKLFAPFAPSADYLLTLARTMESKEGTNEGLSLFLVNNDQEGIRINPLRTIGTNGLYEVKYDNVALSDAQRLGEENCGFEIAQRTIQIATALQCIEMVGVLRRVVEVTSDYVKERKQFNRPIGSFQSVQHRLSDMLTVVEGGWLATYQAMWRLEEGKSAEREIAIAKAWLCKEGQQVLVGAHQLHGGMGIDVDYPLQFCYRRFKDMQLNLGPTSAQLQKIGKTFVKSATTAVNA